MKVSFTQFYFVPAEFPFSHHFQRRLSREVTALVKPSAKFLKKYGSDFNLDFYVSAKQKLRENEIRGPTVSRKYKEVDYTVFLPFDIIVRHADAPKRTLKHLLKGVCDVLGRLEIDITKLLDKHDSIVEGICSDPTMLEEPSWDDEDDGGPARAVFEAFFGKKGNA